MRAVLSCFFIILRKIDLENVCPSVTWNLMGFCLHIGLRWQISCGRFWEYATSKWNAIIWKRKNFFSIFCCIYLIYIKFWTFWKKRWSSWVIYFRNYRLWISWLDHFLKNAVSEHAFTFNMWKRPKYLRNLHFFKFLFHFWILHQILNILKEKMILIANVFSKLQTVKMFVRKLSQEDRFRTGFGSQHVKASQRLAKFPWQAFCHVFFIIFNEVDLVNISPSVR